jgi:hypothetical protein
MLSLKLANLVEFSGYWSTFIFCSSVAFFPFFEGWQGARSCWKVHFLSGSSFPQLEQLCTLIDICFWIWHFFIGNEAPGPCRGKTSPNHLFWWMLALCYRSTDVHFFRGLASFLQRKVFFVLLDKDMGFISKHNQFLSTMVCCLCFLSNCNQIFIIVFVRHCFFISLAVFTTSTSLHCAIEESFTTPQATNYSFKALLVSSGHITPFLIIVCELMVSFYFSIHFSLLVLMTHLISLWILSNLETLDLLAAVEWAISWTGRDVYSLRATIIALFLVVISIFKKE